jgi:hypothetical protein
MISGCAPMSKTGTNWAFLPPQHPPFETAEAEMTPAYVEALEAVRESRRAGQEMMIKRRQLALI